MFKKLKDKRYTAYQRRFKVLVASVMLGIIAGMVIYLSFLSLLSPKPLLNPKGASLAPVQAMEPTSEDCDTPLCYIRLKGQELGYDDYTISGFIRLGRTESGPNLDQYAKNPYSTAKGIYQFIDSTWRVYCLDLGNVYDYKANIDCFYRVLEKDGYPQALSHWRTSLAKAGIQ